MDLSHKTLLITGIGGCIGQRIAELAVARGIKVRGLQRSPDTSDLAGRLGIEMIAGSVTDPEIAHRACKDIDLVIHTAAIVKEEGDLAEFRKVNVEGTLTMAHAAKQAKVKAFVQLSSVVVYGVRYPKYVTESGPFYQGKNPYCLTKLESDQQVLALNNPPDFGVIVIRAGDVYGPRSVPWVIRPLEMMRSRKFFLLNNGRGVMNHVYVDNLVDAIFLALEQEAYGEAFNITDGCETTWKDYYQRLAKIENLPKYPSAPAILAKIILKLFPNNKIGATADTIDISTRRYPYSIEKARHRLGYQPQINLEEGMATTGDWVRKNLT